MSENLNPKKIDLLSLTPEELEKLVVSVGEPKYRAAQIFSQLHKGIPLDEMTNIGKVTRERLLSVAECSFPKIARRLVSSVDGTVKYLFEFSDKNSVEAVVMEYLHGLTVCISSQVGCRMGCVFCASTLGGRVRDLTPGELLSQVLVAQRDMGKRISNIVMMGIGEPLDNYDNVIKFLKLVNDERGVCIGYRKISISTCGVVDKIDRLAQEDIPVTLSISLHAANDATRSSIMPINKKYNVDALLAACRRYYEKTGRRISFEYTLISGKNDSRACAEELASVMNSRLRPNRSAFPIHINLIPVNEVSERGFKPPERSAIEAFVACLESRGIRATVRRRLGPDINASCGQLRRAEIQKNSHGEL